MGIAKTFEAPHDKQITAKLRVTLRIAHRKQAAEGVFLYRRYFAERVLGRSGTLGRNEDAEGRNGLLQRPDHGQPD